MSDQGIWFKLWCSALTDPELDNLSIADFGRWCKLGTLIKSQGTSGILKIAPPARTLCAKMQVNDFSDLISTLKRLPNLSMRACNEEGGQVTVSPETNASVSYYINFKNWLKYQGDFSTYRVRNWREKNNNLKRSKRRGEEKRGEEKRVPPIVPHSISPKPDQNEAHHNHAGFYKFWAAYPRKVDKQEAFKAWRKNVSKMPELDHVLAAVQYQMQSKQWQEENGKFIPHPSTWLNKQRWEDVIRPEDIKRGATDDLPVE